MKKKKLSYIEWMQKINSLYQAPCHIDAGIAHLAKELEYEIPQGVIKK
jgi:hypothetical protein